MDTLCPGQIIKCDWLGWNEPCWKPFQKCFFSKPIAETTFATAHCLLISRLFCSESHRKTCGSWLRTWTPEDAVAQHLAVTITVPLTTDWLLTDAAKTKPHKTPITRFLEQPCLAWFNKPVGVSEHYRQVKQYRPFLLHQSIPLSSLPVRFSCCILNSYHTPFSLLAYTTGREAFTRRWGL